MRVILPIRTDLARCIVLGVACLALPVAAQGQSPQQPQLPPGATAFLNMSYEPVSYTHLRRRPGPVRPPEHHRARPRPFGGLAPLELHGDHHLYVCGCDRSVDRHQLHRPAQRVGRVIRHAAVYGELLPRRDPSVAAALALRAGRRTCREAAEGRPASRPGPRAPRAPRSSSRRPTATTARRRTRHRRGRWRGSSGHASGARWISTIWRARTSITRGASRSACPSTPIPRAASPRFRIRPSIG